MRLEIERLVEGKNDDPLVIVGDFNGHVGYKGEQRLDHNGRMIIDWMEKYNLIMLNDIKCEGLYTWCRNDQRSVTDFALANNKFYEKYHKMIIDEEQERIDLSDHNLLEIYIKAGQVKRNFNSKKWIIREYYKTDEASLKIYSNSLQDSILSEKVKSIADLESRIIKAADKCLKKKYRKKNIGIKKAVEEPEWFTEKIREGIRERKKFNRLCRNETCVRKKGELKKLYLEQKE